MSLNLRSHYKTHKYDTNYIEHRYGTLIRPLEAERRRRIYTDMSL